MERYAKGDKTSCQLEKEILAEELNKQAKIYRNKAQEYYSKGDTLSYLQWDNKNLSVLAQIGDLVNVDCNDLSKVAARYDINLSDELIRQFLDAMAEIKDQVLQTEIGKLFTNLMGAAQIIANIQKFTEDTVNQWKAYIKNLTPFATAFIQNNDGSWIVPWYIDQAKGNQYVDEIVNGEDLPEDVRIKWIIQYEDAVYDFFVWMVKNLDKKELCRYISSLSLKMPEDTGAEQHYCSDIYGTDWRVQPN